MKETPPSCQTIFYTNLDPVIIRLNLTNERKYRNARFVVFSLREKKNSAKIETIFFIRSFYEQNLRLFCSARDVVQPRFRSE